MDHNKEAHQCMGDPRNVSTKEGGAWPVGGVVNPVGRHGTKEAKVHDGKGQHTANGSVEVTEGEHGCKEGGAWEEEGEEPEEPWGPADVVWSGPFKKLYYIAMPVERRLLGEHIRVQCS